MTDTLSCPISCARGPWGQGLLVPLQASARIIEDLLDLLPRLWASSLDVETALGPAQSEDEHEGYDGGFDAGIDDRAHTTRRPPVSAAP